MNSDEIRINPARLANKSECAEWFEVSIPTLNGWIRRGCPCVHRGDKITPWSFDLLAVHEWLAHRVTEARHRKAIDAMSPRDRRLWYEGEKARLTVEALQETLITAEEFQAERARLLGPIAECLDALPDKLAGILPADAVAVARKELKTVGMHIVPTAF